MIRQRNVQRFHDKDAHRVAAATSRAAASGAQTIEKET
jgi:hypothetical protein